MGGAHRRLAPPRLSRRGLCESKRKSDAAVAKDESDKQQPTFPLAQVYRLLEPGPVVLVTTARAGLANIMTLSWHTMMEFEPPLVGCVISDRNYTFKTFALDRAFEDIKIENGLIDGCEWRGGSCVL